MKRGIACAVMAGAVWGLVVLIPSLLPEFSPLLLSCARFVLYGAFSLILALPKARSLWQRLTWADGLLLLKLALTGNLIYFMLLASAIQQAGVATTALIIGVLPVTITLAGRGDQDALPLARLRWPLLLIVAGIACINLHTLLLDSTGGHALTQRLLGIVCAFGALVCWTWFATDNARYLKTSRFDSGEWSSLWGITTGVLGALIWLGADFLQLPAMQIEVSEQRWQQFWLASLACAVLGSWFGNRMWNASSRRLPLTLSGQLIVFETVFSLLYGFLYLQRLPGLLESVASGLLLLGVIWAVRRHLPHSAH
ncbi:DMT family transporter [Pseudomonas chlororaphis]|uniref:DMT family transporter n=1 Tax=Pseudomonas chlororaphis TaxID=587753 RepID=UPI000BE233B1|nr:DMT family transporter [Pseudomonas chlororaphis]